MNILAIGNSFSEDATRYLHDIARADGERLEVTNLYIGGCSLEHHYRNMLSDQRAYELQYNGQKTGFPVSLSDALLNREWDVITLQQVSHLSFNFESYKPYITELYCYVKKFAPNAKIYLHQTWAYEKNSARLHDIAKYESADVMLRDIAIAYSNAAELICADGIIPSGELFAKLIKSGIQPMYRDTFHASLGIGRFALSTLWYHTITKRPTIGITIGTLNEPVSESALCTVKSIVDTF